jgi:methionyl-tRNA formyltransferase
MPPDADLIFCAHAHTYISREARQRARMGTLGYHPSLLPRHQGRDAVEQTIRAGDAIAGGTAYWLDDGLDTGAIAAQSACAVLPGDDAPVLWRRALAPTGAQLIGQVLADLDEGIVRAIPQTGRFFPISH